MMRRGERGSEVGFWDWVLKTAGMCLSDRPRVGDELVGQWVDRRTNLACEWARGRRENQGTSATYGWLQASSAKRCPSAVDPGLWGMLLAGTCRQGARYCGSGTLEIALIGTFWWFLKN
jgi:hypothetical protein